MANAVTNDLAARVREATPSAAWRGKRSAENMERSVWCEPRGQEAQDCMAQRRRVSCDVEGEWRHWRVGCEPWREDAARLVRVLTLRYDPLAVDMPLPNTTVFRAAAPAAAVLPDVFRQDLFVGKGSFGTIAMGLGSDGHAKAYKHIGLMGWAKHVDAAACSPIAIGGRLSDVHGGGDEAGAGPPWTEVLGHAVLDMRLLPRAATEASPSLEAGREADTKVPALARPQELTFAEVVRELLPPLMVQRSRHPYARFLYAFDGVDVAPRKEGGMVRLVGPLAVGALDSLPRWFLNNQAVLVMPSMARGFYRDGGRLDTPVPMEACLVLLKQQLQALALLHHHRMLHRDVKPQNIFFTVSSERMSLHSRLGDFSLAGLVEDPLYSDMLTAEADHPSRVAFRRAIATGSRSSACKPAHGGAATGGKAAAVAAFPLRTNVETVTYRGPIQMFTRRYHFCVDTHGLALCMLRLLTGTLMTEYVYNLVMKRMAQENATQSTANAEVERALCDLYGLALDVAPTEVHDAWVERRMPQMADCASMDDAAYVAFARTALGRLSLPAAVERLPDPVVDLLFRLLLAPEDMLFTAAEALETPLMQQVSADAPLHCLFAAAMCKPACESPMERVERRLRCAGLATEAGGALPQPVSPVPRGAQRLPCFALAVEARAKCGALTPDVDEVEVDDYVEAEAEEAKEVEQAEGQQAWPLTPLHRHHRATSFGPGEDWEGCAFTPDYASTAESLMTTLLSPPYTAASGASVGEDNAAPQRQSGCGVEGESQHMMRRLVEGLSWERRRRLLHTVALQLQHLHLGAPHHCAASIRWVLRVAVEVGNAALWTAATLESPERVVCATSAAGFGAVEVRLPMDGDWLEVLATAVVTAYASLLDGVGIACGCTLGALGGKGNSACRHCACRSTGASTCAVTSRGMSAWMVDHCAQTETPKGSAETAARRHRAEALVLTTGLAGIVAAMEDVHALQAAMEAQQHIYAAQEVDWGCVWLGTALFSLIPEWCCVPAADLCRMLVCAASPLPPATASRLAPATSHALSAMHMLLKNPQTEEASGDLPALLYGELQQLQREWGFSPVAWVSCALAAPRSAATPLPVTLSPREFLVSWSKVGAVAADEALVEQGLVAGR